MPVETWPGASLGRTRFGMTLAGGARSGGRSVAGVETLSSLDGGPSWVGREACSLRTDDAVRIWNGFAWRADGGAVPFEVPCSVRYHRPADITAAALSAPAALRAVDLSITTVGGGALEPGHWFTIDHPNWGARLYAIEAAVSTGANAWDITTNIPLREAVSALDALDFVTPRLVCRVTNADAMPVEENGAVASPQGEVTWAEFMQRVA